MTGRNPRATKQGGVWCKADYPILDWESPEHRIVLPQNLQTALELEEPVLRWARQKRANVLNDHAFDASVIQGIDVYLENWSYCGRERGVTDSWRVLFNVEARWYSLVIGRDGTGSLNVVTVFGSSSTSFLRNRLRGMLNIVEQQKMTSGQGGGPGVS